ncbi:FHA domain containing protein [Fischerella thermalis JSC-11]|uniref:FHA domain containing protein n=1 Tax=Fischerella thermalis JSC-11 TaxID=741277 RepID=G6FX05_9CYAN|nr:GAF domain-containing protein [Fischerella thermalis]EHC11170.1 FHA domain containing protein [Fischerella thermalis JSC-11]
MPYLIYAPDTPNERVYELKQGFNTLGRKIDNTIVLLEETVSRYHAQIHVSSNGVMIKDCGSRNHTFVNQVKVTVSQLRDGDAIACGQLQLRFVHSLKKSQSKPVGDNKELLSDNLKQIPLPQNEAQLQNLVAQKPSDDSIIKLKSRNIQQQTVNKLKILLEVSKQLCSPDEPEQLLQKILDLLFQIMSIDHAVILLVDEKSQQLEPKATKLRDDLVGYQQLYSHKIVNLAYESGDAIITQDARCDQRFNDSFSVVREAIQNCMCVPLKTYTQVIGVLYVDNLSPCVSYTDEDLEFLSALANQAAAAIHMSREFYKREQKLKQEVLELKIQIDQAKKESDIAEIVNLDYFQRLQQYAEQFRNKDNLT